MRIPARAWNELVGGLQPQNGALGRQGPASNDAGRSGNILQVQNQTGAEITGAARVVGLDGVLISAGTNEVEFQQYPRLAAVTPTTADHAGKFGVLVAGLDDDEIGPAYVGGVCAVRVDIQDSDHEFAEVTDGSSDYLTSSDTGSARILYAEGTSGVQWSIVRLADCGSAALPFTGQRVGSNVLISGGTVFVRHGTDMVIPDFSAVAANDSYYYVELGYSTDGTTITVTSTIQVSGTQPAFYAGSATDPTEVNYLIGTTDADGAWTQRWGGGDIYHEAINLRAITGYDDTQAAQLLDHTSGSLGWRDHGTTECST